MELIEFLHLIDDDSDAGTIQGHRLGAWPQIDVRRAYFCSKVRSDGVGGPDMDECFARLYRLHEAGALPIFDSPKSSAYGQIDWDSAWYAVQKELGPPDVDCAECLARGDSDGLGGVTVGRTRHMGRGWMTCSTYKAGHESRCPPNPLGPESCVPGDFYGALTVCGSAWSVNDGPPYCKGCYVEVDPSYDRHDIYRLWEAPDLEHYAKQIGRLL
jgi:hypothetical protein